DDRPQATTGDIRGRARDRRDRVARALPRRHDAWRRHDRARPCLRQRLDPAAGRSGARRVERWRRTCRAGAADVPGRSRRPPDGADDRHLLRLALARGAALRRDRRHGCRRADHRDHRGDEDHERDPGRVGRCRGRDAGRERPAGRVRDAVDPPPPRAEQRAV
ncbi:MAG: Biotin carboxyl carrier protein of acetyl-CoA carboxylase, partial [uncultured Thermomicrobiales bacterium]